MVTELIISGPGQPPKRISLDCETLSIGRSHSNDHSFPDDASLSRKHLRITRESDGVWLDDLGSKNGTMLNGARVASRQRLELGDRITAGQLTITAVESGAEPEEERVIFTPDTDASSATVMTSLEGLFSDEVTTPLQGEGPAAPERDAFDNPIVRVLFKAMRELAAHRPLDELFTRILDMSIEAVGAERGVLMTLEGGKLVRQAMHGEGFRISTTVRDRVLKEKASLLVRDMQHEDALRMQHSISVQNIHTMMAVPLQTEDEVIGLIYVDSRLFIRQFTENDLNLLTILANVAAIRIEQERLRVLEIDNAQAAGIQRGILPPGPPEIGGLDVAGHNEACHSVGGDYYDYLEYPDGRLGLVLGDVAGKGISAALLMSNLQARVQLLAEQVEELCALVGQLDRSIAAHCPTNRFITLFFSVIDPRSGHVAYCNAGHNNPLIVRADGSVDRLEITGTVLGMLPEIGYEQKSVALAPGDLLAVFSDGVTEAASPDEQEFGEERLAEVLAKHREEPAEFMITAVLEAVEEWTAKAPAEDDITLVVARRLAS